MEPPALKLSLCFVASLVQKSDYQRIYAGRKLVSLNMGIVRMCRSAAVESMKEC